MRKIIALFLVLLVFALVGCSTNGATGNFVNDQAVDNEYAEPSNSPQKKVKMTGTGHEQTCY